MTQPDTSNTIVVRDELAKNRRDIETYGDVRHYFVGSKSGPVEDCRRCHKSSSNPVHLDPPKGA